MELFFQVKHTKFNESGQLLAFYLVSLVWAGDIVLRENLLSIRTLWEGYPHTNMTFMFKFFFIVQASLLFTCLLAIIVFSSSTFDNFIDFVVESIIEKLSNFKST